MFRVRFSLSRMKFLSHAIGCCQNTCSKFKVLHQGTGWERGGETAFHLVLKILAYEKEKGKHTLWGLES